MIQNDIYILGIESSCDDTSVAVIRNDKILANIVAGQEVHRQYGGVVPELASRSHQAHIVPVTEMALRTANIAKKDLHAVAYTRGPGLLGSLLVGASFAKGLALGLRIPLIEVNHMQAHILAHFIEGSNRIPNGRKPQFPFLCLTVSGGHTQLVKVSDHFSMEVVGETIDDAAGEAFDKVAKLLDLPYPGGPSIDKLAREGDPLRFRFARPEPGGLNFSFSGLKTSVLYFLRNALETDPEFVVRNRADIAASFQHTVVEILMHKLRMAAAELGIADVALAGGVSANSALQQALVTEAGKKGWNIFIPAMEYCTDNAAMIAVTGYFKYLRNDFSGQEIAATARLDL